MINQIIEILGQLGISDYSITEKTTQSMECFFIRRNLDLKRSTNLLVYMVTVFHPFETKEKDSHETKKLLGSSFVQLYPGMEAAEIKKALLSAYNAASFVANPWYEMVSGTKQECVLSSSDLAKKDLKDTMKEMADALFASDIHSDVFINSAEVFAARTMRHIVNSRGVDVCYETVEVNGEYVVQCISPQDVETYHHFSYRDLDTDALRRDVEEALDMTSARAKATDAPKAGTYRVILSGEQMYTFLQYYMDRSDSSLIYQKYSGYQTGMQVQGDRIQGDLLTMVLKARDPYSGEGIPMKDRVLLENGTLRTIHGGSRFAYYLGIEPTGGYDCISVPVGNLELSEMKKSPYLHIVSFSDFQMNSFSGHFGGEIRLAYLWDGTALTPVTGGSINGSIMKVQENMIFSKERYKSGKYEGPFAVSLEGIQVAGV